jgi:hypothetical protein
MSWRATQHRRGAVALGLVLALSIPALACGSDHSSPTGASSAHPNSNPRTGPVTTGFDRPAALGRAEVKGASITADAAHDGTGGLDITSTGGDAYIRWNAGILGEGHPYWTFRAWMRVVDWTRGESVDLFTVRNVEVKNNFDLFVGAPYRRLQWDLYRENSGEAPPFELGRWYLIEAKGSFKTSTYTADVRIDGQTQPSIASTDQPPSAVSEFILGSVGTAKSNRAQFDDLRIELGDEPLPFLGGPSEPSTSTGPNPTRSTSGGSGSRSTDSRATTHQS